MGKHNGSFKEKSKKVEKDLEVLYKQVECLTSHVLKGLFVRISLYRKPMTYSSIPMSFILES